MTTATAKPPKKSKPTGRPLPQFLALPAHTGLTAKNEAAVDAYLIDVEAYADRVAELHSRRRNLLATGGSRTVDEFAAEGAELVKERAELVGVGTQLAWRRIELLQQMVPDVKAAAVQAEVDFNEEIRKERESIEMQGITPACMPASKYGSNPEAANHQFEHFLATRDPCLVMKGIMHTRQQEHTQVLNMSQGIVHIEMVAIPWERTATDRDALFAQLGGVEHGK